MSVKPMYVDCIRDGNVFKKYEFGIPIGMLPGAPPDRAKLIDDAKDNLTNDGLANPPYDGIIFRVRD